MKLAAVIYATGTGPATDDLLARVALDLQRAGLKLAGAVQTNEPRAGTCRCDMTLEDLASGRRIAASEDRGPLAQGCRLDTGALEEVVGLVAASLRPEIDLVIVNRFGKREAEGHGFRPVIEAAVLLDIPVLVALNEAHRAAWNAFAGEETVHLPPAFDSVGRWCEGVLPGLEFQALGIARSAIVTGGHGMRRTRASCRS
jgi:nucleoside-triphosphatase THEP1